MADSDDRQLVYLPHTDARSTYEWSEHDLAPGDRRSADMQLAGINAYRVNDSDDPKFRVAFESLWSEFGHLNEMEPEAVIRERFRRELHRVSACCATYYEMCVLERGGQLLGVRDHTAILRMQMGKVVGVVVHLSHVLLSPSARGTGLAGWMRAIPMQTARRALALAGSDGEDVPVVIVGEMEAPESSRQLTEYRLRSYGNAGFLAVDPSVFPYCQPDFRPREAIDSDGFARPVPLRLVIRRIGREAESTLPWSEALEIGGALFDMYEAAYREGDITPLRVRLRRCCADLTAPIALVDPTR